MSEGTAFYRCVLCNSAVSPWDIGKGGCQKCAGTRIIPANLSLREKIVQLWKHPKFWTWPQ